jgi:hypothetical protein
MVTRLMQADFNDQWWHSFKQAWLRWGGNKAPFSEIRRVCIRITDVVDGDTLLSWDHRGELIDTLVGYSAQCSIPTFSGSKEAWSEFIYDGIPAAKLLLLGKITYKGALSFLLQWGQALGALSEVGREVSQL